MASSHSGRCNRPKFVSNKFPPREHTAPLGRHGGGYGGFYGGGGGEGDADGGGDGGLGGGIGGEVPFQDLPHWQIAGSRSSVGVSHPVGSFGLSLPSLSPLTNMVVFRVVRQWFPAKYTLLEIFVNKRGPECQIISVRLALKVLSVSTDKRHRLCLCIADIYWRVARHCVLHCSTTGQRS